VSQIVLKSVGDLLENAVLDSNPAPAVGAEEVLVAIEAAPINPVDFLYAAGWYGVPPTVGTVLGTEGVGRVLEVGPGADDSLLGRRVIILANLEQGTWADRTVVPARNVVAIGDEGDATQLAQLSVNPATAHIMLNHYGSLKPDDWIGQTIGNSAIGEYIVKLAKLAGYKTLSVVRSEKAAEQVRSFGGDLVVIQGENLAVRIAEALGDRQLDLVLDGEGGETISAVVQSLKFGGTAVAYSSMTGAPQVVGLGDLIYRQLELKGFWLVNWLRDASREEIEATYAELATLMSKGEISSAVEATYSLSDHRAAFAHARTPGRSGKVMFTFGDTAR
jgi:NADPH:quinone reductase-like Zn-dependent oxidoreductase